MLWRNAFLTALVALIALSFLPSLRRSRRGRLAAIGIGHPVDQYYKQGITIRAPEELGDTLVQLINRLLHPSP
ncbi:hypothetical protein JQ587_05455 [Bradyrhizobium manausense]|nr:hypothetical protein [Bradyrhizobium manausense]